MGMKLREAMRLTLQLLCATLMMVWRVPSSAAAAGHRCRGPSGSLGNAVHRSPSCRLQQVSTDTKPGMLAVLRQCQSAAAAGALATSLHSKVTRSAHKQGPDGAGICRQLASAQNGCSEWVRAVEEAAQRLAYLPQVWVLHPQCRPARAQPPDLRSKSH